MKPKTVSIANVKKETLPKVVKGKTSKLDKKEEKRRKGVEKDNLNFLNAMVKQNPEYYESVKKAKELSGQAEAERQGRNANVPDIMPKKRMMGGASVPKKSIMELPTNVPRLQGGKLLGDLDKDGKMSGYETARQKAIEKSMAEQKKAMSGLAIGIKKVKKNG
tara:strand:- start:11397 stop:11885 length:489 start_codon:yes stop_codon:yes gene_type:complete